MMKHFLSWLLLMVAFSLSPAQAGDRITQVSTIDALLAGFYDGDMSCESLLAHGDFGIGTFDDLNGEMLVLKGKIYQVKADGSVWQPDLSIETPYAVVCKFKPEMKELLKERLDYEGFKGWMDQWVKNKNIFCAIYLEGTFKSVHTRSVPPQSKPYPPLVDIAKEQPEFHMKDIQGTLVGFRSPAYVKGIGVPGYHLHFLSKDKKQGGHVLGFSLSEGEVFVDQCKEFLMVLPEEENGLEGLDLSKDRSAELKEVEQ